MSSKPRDVQDFYFKQLRKLKVFTAAESVSSDVVNLIAVSNRYGLIFIGYPKGFKVIKAEDVLALNDRESLRIDVEEYPCHNIPLDSPPTHLAVNSDDMRLSVCTIIDSCPFASIYDIRHFGDKDIIPRPITGIRLATQPSIALHDLYWNPSIANILAACLSDGSIAVYEINDASLKICGSLPSSSGCKAICWSPKGKQLVVGKINGTLSQYKPTLEEMKVIPPPSLFGKPVSVLNVLWLSNFCFAVAYCCSDDPEERPSLVIVRTPKNETPSYINYEDVCYSSGDQQKSRYLMFHQSDWGVILCTSSNAIEVGVLGASSSDKTVWEQWILEDSGRAELPLSGKDETFPIGMGVCYNSCKEIYLGENLVIPPMPLFLLLSTKGLLVPFYMVNTSPGSVSLIRPPEKIVYDGPIPGIRSSSISEPPTPKINLMEKFNQVSESSLNQNASFQLPSSGLTAIAQSTPLATTKAFSFTSDVPGIPPFKADAASSSSGQAQLPSGGIMSGTPVITASKGSKPVMPSSASQGSTSSGSLFSSIQSQSGVLTPKTGPTLSRLGTDVGNVEVKPGSNGNMSTAPMSALTQLVANTGVNIASTSQPSLIPDSGSGLLPGKPFFAPFLNVPNKTTPQQSLGTLTPGSTLSHPKPLPTEGKGVFSIPPPSGSLFSSIQSQPGVLTPKASPSSSRLGTSVGTDDSCLEGEIKLSGDKTYSSKNVFTTAVLKEIENFNKELQDLKTRSSTISYLVGTPDEIRSLKESTEKLTQFAADIKETTLGLSNEVHALRSQILESFVMMEEARSRGERNKDTRYRQLLQLRALDPVQSKKIKNIRQLHHYVQSQTQEVHQLLDQQWEEIQASKTKQKKMVKLPTSETVYQCLLNIQNLISVSNQKVDQLQKLADQVGQQDNNTSFRISLNPRTALSLKTKDDIHSLSDSFINFKLEPPIIAKTSTKKISPEKQAKLRSLLGNRRPLQVRTSLPSSMSRLIVPKSQLEIKELGKSKTDSQVEISVDTSATPSTKPITVGLPTNQFRPVGTSHLGTASTQATTPISVPATVPSAPLLFTSAAVKGNSPTIQVPSPTAQPRPIIGTSTTKSPFTIPTGLGTGETSMQTKLDASSRGFSFTSLHTPNFPTFSSVTVPSTIDKASSTQSTSTFTNFASSKSPVITTSSLALSSFQFKPVDTATTDKSIVSQQTSVISFSKPVPTNLAGNASSNFTCIQDSNKPLSIGNAPLEAKLPSTSSDFSFTLNTTKSGDTKTLFTFGSKTQLGAGVFQFGAPNITKSADAASSFTFTLSPKDTFSKEKKLESVQEEETKISGPVVEDVTPPSTPTEDVSNPLVEEEEETGQGGVVIEELTDEYDIQKEVEEKSPDISSKSKAVSAPVIENEPHEPEVAVSAANSPLEVTVSAPSTGQTSFQPFKSPSSETSSTPVPTLPQTTFKFIQPSSSISASITSSSVSESSVPVVTPSFGQPAAGLSVPAFGFQPSQSPAAFGQSTAVGSVATTESSMIPTTSCALGGTVSIFGGSSVTSSGLSQSTSTTITSSTTSTVSPSSTFSFRQPGLSFGQAAPSSIVFGQTTPAKSSSAFDQVTTSSTTAPAFSQTTTTSTGTSVFGQTTTTTTSAPAVNPVFSQTPATSTITSGFGQTTTTTASTVTSVFGQTPATSAATPGLGQSSTTTTTTSLFGQPATTTATAVFGQPAATTTATAVFGQPAATTTAPAVFGQPAATTTAPAVFGQPTTTTTATALFGQPATTTTATAVFGQPTTTSATTFGFGQTTSTATPAFGQSTTSGVFGSPASGSTTFGFGQSSANTGSQSLFGGSTSANTQSTFGQKSLFGASSFGQLGTGTFQQNATNPVFGQSGSSVFGGSTTQTGSVFGQSSGEGFFSGLGGKPSAENANKNVFGGSSTFGAVPVSPGQTLFGNQGSPTGFSNKFGSSFSGGSFSRGNSSVAQSGFGGFQQPSSPQPAPISPKPGGFGSSPTFGGSPSFGSVPAFGGTPVFGSSQAFGSPGGNQPPSAFGSFGSGAVSPTFGALAAQTSPTFGNLAQSSNVPTFGSVANASGTGFGTQNTPFGSAPVFGGTAFGSQPQQQQQQQQQQQPQGSSGSSFSQWR